MFFGDFFRGKKVLVTGHTGFIGSWLTKCLTMQDAEVCGYSLDPPSKPNMYDLLNLSDSVIDIREDIRNREAIQKTILDFNPEIVLHLAAQPIVGDSYDNPVETFDTNVTGTVNLLNELRQVDSIKTIIVMTSDKSYRNNEWVYPYRENDILGGKDPYSASKSCQDIVVDSFRDSFFKEKGVGISSIRAGNVIGGGDFGKYRIMPDIVRAIGNNDTLRIRNPDSVRPWQHVLEPISGMMVLTKRMYEDTNFSGPWNFGPDSLAARTVKELVEKFIYYYGKGNYEIQSNQSFKESSHLQIDISKAKRDLNWNPCLNFDNTVKKTVEWYKAFLNNQGDLNKITEMQINEYSQIAWNNSYNSR
jgi:CDP-glucose 4,6-dehydratase